jgi:hypothetical protein
VPEAVTEKVAVCPTRMDTLTGCAVIEGATPTPVPPMETEKAELSCALVNEALPDALPAAAGAKVAVNVTLFPGFRVTGRATPVRLNPVPDALA